MSGRSVAALAAALLACGGTPSSAVDAAVEPNDAASAPDAASTVPLVTWSTGPDLPAPLAHATAQIISVDGVDFVYVIGGSDADRTTLGTFSSAAYRSAIAADGSLAPWEPLGDITIGGMPRGLVGHGSQLISDAMGHQGIAMAGGGTMTSALPIVLAVYVDTEDGHLFDWSRFPPTLDEGQSFGTFDAFEPDRLALVGGLTSGAFTDRVRIAPTDNASMAMEWTVGPSLPAPRGGHASFKFANRIYLFGGENIDGPVADVLRTTRDADGAIDGWETVGTIDAAPVGSAALSYARHAWLLGGIEGGSFDGQATARVRRGALETDGTVAPFEDADPLPLPLANSAVATTGRAVYLVGGQTGADLEAVPTVLVGLLD